MNIERIATYNVAPLIEALEANAKRFSDITIRQDVAGTPHPDTETIYLRFPPEITMESVFEGMDVIDYPACKGALNDAIWSISIGEAFLPARAMVIKLKPGGVIRRHYDSGGYSEATERFHLPIVTNPNAWLACGDQVEHMEAGGLYRFDKHEWHYGANEGETDRIHLVADLWR